MRGDNVVEGFTMDMSHILDEADTLNKTPSELKRIADEAMNNMQASIVHEAPYKKGRTQRSVKRISKVRGFSAEVTVYVGAWWAKSLNDGNSKTRKHVGWFDRAVENEEEQVFNTVQEMLGW